MIALNLGLNREHSKAENHLNTKFCKSLTLLTKPNIKQVQQYETYTGQPLLLFPDIICKTFPSLSLLTKEGPS